MVDAQAKIDEGGTKIMGAQAKVLTGAKRRDAELISVYTREVDNWRIQKYFSWGGGPHPLSQ